MSIQRIQSDPETVTYGQADINSIVKAFEQNLELKMPRAQFQRRAAKTLLQQHGYDRVAAAIAYVAATRDQEYVPQIVSLEDLRDKWNRLELYARKHSRSVDTDEAIRQMTEGR
ncbi:hypothetical protein [Pedococcus soli]